MDSLLDIFDFSDTNSVNDRSHLPKTSTLLTGASTLPPEQEQGNVEYKLKLINPSHSRLQQLTTQMKWRLEEGDGEAIYEIGVEDNGQLKGLTQSELDASMKTIHLMAKRIGASVSVLRERLLTTKNGNNGCRRKVLEVLVRKVNDDKQTDEVRIVVLGNVEAGKSSLLGVLTQGETDNGKGRARLNLFRHRHEIRTGRTSSINKEILGFDKAGSPITYNEHQTQEEICQLARKIIVFIDSAGHKKYLKTTVFGLTAMHADYAIMVVNALTGIDAGTNKQHLSLALALELPIIAVVNKIDLCSQSSIMHTLRNLQELISSPFCGNKSPLLIESEQDVISYLSCKHQHQLVPILLISCVTGVGIDLLYKLLQVLKPSINSVDKEKLTKEKIVFQVDETFNIQNVGIVVSGFLCSGLIEEGSTLKAGPLEDGTFFDVYVSSLQRHKVYRRYVRPGESSTLALKAVEHQNEQTISLTKNIRKGMVLLSECEQSASSVCIYFKVHVFVMPGSMEIHVGFQGMVFIENVRQRVTVVAIEESATTITSTDANGYHRIAANESGSVILQFNRHPEFVCTGYRMLLQQGQTKVVGHLTQVFPYRD